MNIYIDGKFYGEDEANISVLDHGLLYGDGIFEGIRAYNGRVFKLKEQLDRCLAAVGRGMPAASADWNRKGAVASR